MSAPYPDEYDWEREELAGSKGTVSCLCCIACVLMAVGGVVWALI